MKKWGAVVLIIFLILNTFNEASIFIAFKLNQSKITELFCINKDKPELKCNGQCHLAEVIEDNQEEENSPYSNSTETREVIVLFIQLITPYYFQPSAHDNTLSFKDNFIIKEFKLGNVFHPPKA